MKEVRLIEKLYKIQSVMLFLVGIGALFGGMLAISDPYGASYGMPIETLRRSPFTSFLVPGLFLFFIIGVGHLISFIAVKRKMKFHTYISGGEGCILMAWILIQCYILQSIHFLHITFFIIGFLESVIALYIIYKLKLFPYKSQGEKREKYL